MKTTAAFSYSRGLDHSVFGCRTKHRQIRKILQQITIFNPEPCPEIKANVGKSINDKINLWKIVFFALTAVGDRKGLKAPPRV